MAIVVVMVFVACDAVVIAVEEQVVCRQSGHCMDTG